MKDETTELEALPGSPEPEEEQEVESGKMSFLEHLDELRRRLLHIIAYIGIGLVASFYFAPQIYDFLAAPVVKADPNLKLVYNQLTQPIKTYIWVAVLAGIFLTSPLTLYEVWKFISPGLYKKEKKYVLPFLFFAVLLFLTGGAFCYYIVLPQAYGFLLKIGQKFTPLLTIDSYMDLTNTMILGFAVMFELPVVVAFLSMFGLVTWRFLLSKFKYAVLIIFVVAAVLSPTPDALTQCIYAGPMVLLYIISIGIAAIFGWRRKLQGLD